MIEKEEARKRIKEILIRDELISSVPRRKEWEEELIERIVEAVYPPDTPQEALIGKPRDTSW